MLLKMLMNGIEKYNVKSTTNQNGDVGYGSSGYSSVFDMFDGGGAGSSGDKYSGGGRLSDVGNIFTRR
mgnify:CR=1 FL=1